MNIISKKYIFLTFSGLLVLASISTFYFFGLKQGIDFTGGSLWQVRGAALTQELIQKILPEAIITFQPNENSFLIRAKELTESQHQSLLVALKKESGVEVEELSFSAIGPAIGKELRSKSIWAFAAVILGISLYIAFAFRKVSKPVSSWKYGLITLVTLFHDAIIPTGLMAVLGKLANIEIDSNFIVAILVVMGFSVHDTIVVFDRIRENLRIAGNKNFDFNDLVNKSIGETFARSVNTSLTLILVLLAMYFLGAGALSYFVLVILIGTIFGTYSSIFVASPLLTLIK
ncbi:MAG: protein translocase subunit SecF [Patescibacteria group bacterium]